MREFLYGVLTALALWSVVRADDVPPLPGKTNWGNITQAGRNFTIKGHASWEAEGRFRDDGKVVIIWTLLSTKECCPGVYEWDGIDLIGVWGYAGMVFIDEAGELQGETRGDRITKEGR